MEVDWKKLGIFTLILGVLTVDLFILGGIKNNILIAQDINNFFSASPTLKLSGLLLVGILVTIFAIAVRRFPLRTLFPALVIGFTTVLGIMMVGILFFEAFGSSLVVNVFYILSHSWMLLGVGLLFWTLANELFTIEEAKLAYPLMGIAASLFIFPANITVGLDIQVNVSIFCASIFILVPLFMWLSCQNFKPIEGAIKEVSTPQFFTHIFLIGLIIFFYYVCQTGIMNGIRQEMLTISAGDAGIYNNLQIEALTYSILVPFIVIALTFWIPKFLRWSTAASLPGIALAIGTVLVYLLRDNSTFANILAIPEEQVTMYGLTILKSMMWGFLVTLFLPTKEIAYMVLPRYARTRSRYIVEFVLLAGKTLLLAPIISTLFTPQTLIGIDNLATQQTNYYIWIAFGGALVWVLIAQLLSRSYESIKH